MNEDVITSAKHSIEEVKSDENKAHLTQLDTLNKQMEKLKDGFNKLKSKPSRKDLERKFSALEGAVLSDIDNLKRKVKKLKLSSPEVNDIQCSVENLEVIINHPFA